MNEKEIQCPICGENPENCSCYDDKQGDIVEFKNKIVSHRTEYPVFEAVDLA